MLAARLLAPTAPGRERQGTGVPLWRGSVQCARPPAGGQLVELSREAHGARLCFLLPFCLSSRETVTGGVPRPGPSPCLLVPAQRPSV